MAPVLYTFGLPRLTSNGEPVPLHAKELAMLVYLRVTGSPQARGALGALLWGKTAIGRNNSVNTAISALRRVLPPGAIPPGSDPVRLAVEVGCDADLLVRAAGGQPGPVEEALAAFRAPFLDGFEFQVGEGAEAFVGWLREQREGFRRRAVSALEEACGRAEAGRDWRTLRRLAALGQERIAGWDAAPWLQAARRGERRRRWGWIAAAGVIPLAAAAMLLRRPATGAAECAPGDARAHLVRQIYPAEANTAIRVGERYTPTWFLKNVGTCAWGPGARVVRTGRSGPAPLSDGRPRVIEAAVLPDSVAQVEVPLRGPAPVGRYGEDWRLLDHAGRPIRVDGGVPLQMRFQRLPARVAQCRPAEVHAELLGQSHPGRENPMHPGQSFENTWTLVNRGACVWNRGLALHFASTSGPRLSAPGDSVRRIEEAVLPSDAYTFSVPMRAPAAAGSYRESWRLTGPGGGAIPVSEEQTVDVHVAVVVGQLRASAPECGLRQVVPTFMRAERVADGTVVRPGALVPKEWTLDNHGDCTWTPGSLRLHFHHAEPEFPHGAIPDVAVDQDVPPTGTFTFRSPFRAPVTPGHYQLFWQALERDGHAVRISATPMIWTDITVAPARTLNR
jgi:methionine-rich copper-binding protein CopC